MRYGMSIIVRGDGATLCHTNHFIDAEASAWQSPLADYLSTVPRLACARRHAAAPMRSQSRR